MVIDPSVFYRPQRSWAKVIFLQASVCPRGGVSASVHAGMPPPPPGADPRTRHTTPPQTRHTTPQTRHTTPPPDQTHHPPGPDTPPPHPRTRHTRPPGPGTPPKADSGIRSMSGWYASYWNAFLFLLNLNRLLLNDILHFLCIKTGTRN